MFDLKQLLNHVTKTTEDGEGQTTPSFQFTKKDWVQADKLRKGDTLYDEMHTF